MSGAAENTFDLVADATAEAVRPVLVFGDGCERGSIPTLHYARPWRQNLFRRVGEPTDSPDGGACYFAYFFLRPVLSSGCA